jgi:hypothetical protein
MARSAPSLPIESIETSSTLQAVESADRAIGLLARLAICPPRHRTFVLVASLPVTFRSAALDESPVCWTRVEFNEERFVEACAGHTDGVVIALRFDTPPPRGSPAALRGKTGSELKNAALAAGVPYQIDIETWRLPFLRDADDDSFGSDARTSTAGAVPLPLTPADLADDTLAQPLVRAAITAQVGAVTTFAPYFGFTALDDRWLDVNLRCLRLTRALAGPRPVGAWIHVSLETMLSGVLRYAASRYAAELPPEATVVLTVSDFGSSLEPAALAQYFRALQAFDASGLRVTVDRAGEVSVAAMATYAVGCMLGTRLYRTAPPAPSFASEINPKIPLSYYVAQQVRRVSRAVARTRQARGRLPTCPSPKCVAAKADDNANLLLRLHNAHGVRHEVRRARALGAPQLVRIWSKARLKHLRVWAQALELAIARSEEA